MAGQTNRPNLYTTGGKYCLPVLRRCIARLLEAGSVEVGRENAYDCQNKMNDQEELIRLVSDGSDRNDGEDGKSYPG